MKNTMVMARPGHNVLRATFAGMLLAALVVLAPVAGFAQETASSIRGNVVNADGSPVAGATVVVIDQRTSVARSYTTNDSGTFFASNLPVGGPYLVTVAGQKSVEIPSIALGDMFNLTVEIDPGADVDEIVVVGDALQSVE